MIFFTEKFHRYFNDYDDDIVSVSKKMEEYKNKFDDSHAERIAYQKKIPSVYEEVKEKIRWSDPNMITVLKENVSELFYNEVIMPEKLRIKNEWHQMGIDSSEYGTDMHSKNETNDMLEGFINNPFDGKEYRVIRRQDGNGYQNSFHLHEILKMKENVCLLEGLVGSEKYKIAGQEDKIFFRYTGAGYFHVFNTDYKTDKVVKRKSMFLGNGFQMFKNELMNFYDCNFYTYAMKASIYSVLTEMFSHKFKVIDNAIKAIPKDKEVSFIRLPYYQKHAEFIIKKGFE